MTLEEFNELRDTEDFFKFFNIEYDPQLINVKRFHIMKAYGNLIKDGFSNFQDDEQKLLDFLKFSLHQVYNSYKEGNHPSAAEVWNMFERDALGCLSCTPTPGNSCGC